MGYGKSGLSLFILKKIFYWVCCSAFQYKEQEREQEDDKTVSNHITEEPSVLVIYLKESDRESLCPWPMVVGRFFCTKLIGK